MAELGLLFLLAAPLSGADQIPDWIRRGDAPPPELQELKMELLLVTPSGTETIESRSDVLIPGEPLSLYETYTLELGTGRMALVDVSLEWTPIDRSDDVVLLDVDSRAGLTSAVGWSSREVGDKLRREERIQARKGQVHLYDLWVSEELRARFVAGFTWGEASGYRPDLVPSLDPVSFRIRAYDRRTWRRKDLVQEAEVKSLGGRSVGFHLSESQPVVMPKSADEDGDPSGLVRPAADTGWMGNHVSDPVKIPNRKVQEKQRKEMRKRLEKGKLTQEDLAILQKAREEKERTALRVERAEMSLKPLFTGRSVLRLEVRLEADLVYPASGLEAHVDSTDIVDYRPADILTFDLLELADVESPDLFPHRYTLEVRAYW